MTNTSIKNTEFDRAGVYLDHASATVMSFHDNEFTNHTIVSKFTHSQKSNSLGKSENLMHHKEQHEQKEYYHEIADLLRPCKEVIIFGPTTAKDELHNLMSADHNFAKISVKVKSSDQLNTHQQEAFVRDFYGRHL